MLQLCSIYWYGCETRKDQYEALATTDEKGQPGRPRDTEIDAAILRAALSLFVEKGLDGVGIEQVAERAGVARTTVYRRWSSTASIVAKAIVEDRGVEDERVLQSSGLPQTSAESTLDALTEIIGLPRYRQMVGEADRINTGSSGAHDDVSEFLFSPSPNGRHASHESRANPGNGASRRGY